MSLKFGAFTEQNVQQNMNINGAKPTAFTLYTN